MAAEIGLTEVVTKMILFYGHERIWNRIPLGRSLVAQSMESKSGESDSIDTKLNRFSLEKQQL